MKTLRGLGLQIKGVKAQVDEELLMSPQSVRMAASLDGISSLSLSYSEVQMPGFLFEKNELGFPNELRALVSVEEGSHSEERCLFRGPMSRFQHISHHDHEQILFHFSDPLVVARERDKTMIWSGESLKTIVDALFKGAYKGSGKDITSEFLGDSVPSPKTITNMDKDNLRFIAEDIALRYGYRFYFDHSKTSDDKIKFFRPEAQPSTFKRLGASEFLRSDFQFASDFNAASNSVCVHGSGGTSTVAKLEDLMSDLPEGSKARIATRDENQMKLQMNWAFPNLVASEAELVAKSMLMRSAWSADVLEFTSESYFELGEYVRLESDERAIPAYLEGHFLVESVQREYRGPMTHWIHRYRGVRA